MNGFAEPRKLGPTGLTAGRLGVSGGYGAPAAAFEMAFERGCNYFYHGSMRKPGMNEAIKNLTAAGRREDLIILAQAYTRSAWHLKHSLRSFLRKTGLDSADILLLGWYNSAPSARILDACAQLREQGLFRFLAVSGHNRPAFVDFAAGGKFDVFHIRYNAAHRGAESEVFARLPEQGRPGIVTYTATRWGKLLKPRLTPKGEATPRASDCYRFVLSNPGVDVCMTGPKDLSQMKEALASLDRGPMSEDELAWMRRVGDHLHSRQ